MADDTQHIELDETNLEHGLQPAEAKTEANAALPPAAGERAQDDEAKHLEVEPPTEQQQKTSIALLTFYFHLDNANWEEAKKMLDDPAFDPNAFTIRQMIWDEGVAFLIDLDKIVVFVLL